MTYNYTGLEAGESDHTMPTMAELKAKAEAENGRENQLPPGTHSVFIKNVKLYLAKTGTEQMIVVFQDAKRREHSEFMTLTFKPFPILRISELWEAVGAAGEPSPEPWNDVEAHKRVLINSYLKITIEERKDPGYKDKLEVKKFEMLTDDELNKVADEFQAELTGSGHAGPNDDIPF